MGVEDGTYQILRARLADRAAELGRRAAELNSRRQQAFGSRPLELVGSARPRTAGEGTARGIVAVRPGVLLLGTSAPGLDAGLLSLHALDGSALGPERVPGLLDDERFRRDLAELLRYYRDARLADLVHTASGRLLAVFRTGENDGDLRVLSWQLGADRVEYLGNHGERDLPQPSASELPWRTTGREDHTDGRILIEGGEGAVSVATTGGSLTVHAVPGDRPLFREPVDEPLQSLADATVGYAVTGPLLLLRIRPYNEPADRYLVVNTRTGSVRRQDSLGRGARLLPAEQGLIFPGGYELADGSHRTFRIDGGIDGDSGTTAGAGAGTAADGGLYFDAVLPAPNGEDLLYVLRRPGRAQVLLLPWNTVRREAASALHAAAHTLLPDGTLVLLRADREPVRTHELQLWQTPFQSAEYAAAQAVGDGPLERIGNADLVHGIAECLDVVRTATAAAPENPAAAAPELILDVCAKAADRHYWLADTGLLEPLAELRDAAEQLVAEQTRIRQLAARAARELDRAREEAAGLIRRSHGEPPADADGWTALLAELRRAQGRTRTLRELPQLDAAALDRVEADLADELTTATERAFVFFAGPDAFAAPLAAALRAAEDAASVATAAEAERLTDGLTEQADALATVTDLVTGAVTADPGATTAVLLAIGEVLAAVNRARAVLANRRRVLLDAVRTALRELRDRADLTEDGGAAVRLGRHRFAVRREPVELTLQPDGDGLAFAVTGTGYRRPAHLPELLTGREFWTQPLVSESPALYRAEYLAAALLPTATAGEPLLDQVRRAAESAYDEGYERGVHDHDATVILGALLRLRAGAGLLEHPAEVRATAQLFWAHATTDDRRAAWQRRARSLALARAHFGPDGAAPVTAWSELAAELSEAVAAFTALAGLPPVPRAGEYLVAELADPHEGFATGPAVRTLLDGFRHTDAAPALTADLAALGTDLPACRQLAAAWLGSYAAVHSEGEGVPEAVAHLCAPGLARYEIAGAVQETVDGLLGVHPRVRDGRLTVRLDELPHRAQEFREERAPAFRAFQRRRADVLAAERARLRLDDHRPRPLAGFVRNQLIDRVYLPLVGDNLARQLGTLDPTGPADRSGLLLLLSPPGYGKTTLLEYVADRLGLLMVRVDGPALGTGTTSLDPDRAPDAAARREVEKIVFALEAGSNVLLHLDDIQHVGAELLQKFIPLCDAQRRIEAVADGVARSFDLRGRRFAVCLAGNPYTANGQRFQIPDMLANRADVWNLGEVLSGHDDLFALSFLENALAANPVLAPLAGADPADLRLLVALADGDPTAQADQLAHPVLDLDRVLATLTRLRGVQRTVLAVNRAYIASAAQEDAGRREPPFLLQGSYRTMAQLAGRIDPVQSEAEVETLLDDHYLAEARTLGSAAEANLLALARLRGRSTPEQSARWNALCAAYASGGSPSAAYPSAG
ncbi:DNA repair ATPase [Streptomyces sp. NPDC059629]|uniref:DNA repair ATPase n=1 Tax=Streptomyces sp. NPDC059629 TaxID=3346889 RepID=UPI0036A0E83F